MTTAARNAKFEEHFSLIDQAIQEYNSMLQSAGLSEEDVRQDLSVMLLEALEVYDPGTRLSLEAYIYKELVRAVMNMAAPSKLHGVPWAPLRQPLQVVSLDAANDERALPFLDERPACIWIQDEIASLPDAQRTVINKLLYGESVHCNNKSLLKARRYLRRRMDEVGITKAQEWKECICFA